MDWVDLAQDMNRWWALVNAVMYLRVPSKRGGGGGGKDFFKLKNQLPS
jgi:hypothetical protein